MLFTKLTRALRLLIGLSPTLALSDPRAGRAIGTSVTIESGPIEGTTTLWAGPTAISTVTKFLGVPYAKSPPARFMPPEPAESWTTVRSAKSFSSQCMQQADPILANYLVADLPQSEDCLYINVWVPPGTTTQSAKAVMFWIYGGSLQTGTGGMSMYDGSALAANKDVIVVNFNYRLNVFGYSNSPQVPAAERNAGFLDQRLALQWVQDNIAFFGGDPNKVMIFGESAGGYSVKQLLALPPSPLPFHSAIIQSQGAQPVAADTGAISWNRLTSLVGCNETSDSALLECMQGVDAASLQTATSGKAANVPTIIGHNYNDGSLFALGAIHSLPSNTTCEYAAETIFSSYPALAAKVNTYYADYNLSDCTSEIVTDIYFKCPAKEIAAAVVSAGIPTWRYLFNTTFTNANIHLGVYHTSEIPQVFGTYTTLFATAQQIANSLFMQGAWSSLAKNPASGPGWVKYGSTGNIGDIGVDGSWTQVTKTSSVIDARCDWYTEYLADVGV